MKPAAPYKAAWRAAHPRAVPSGIVLLITIIWLATLALCLGVAIHQVIT